VTRRLLAVGLLALVAAGCAIPTQQGPSTIAASHVPFNLLSPQPPSTTTTQPVPSSLVPVTVYLLSSTSQLQAVQRVVYSPAPLTSVITAMLAGPDKAETAKNISTAIPNNVMVISAVISALPHGTQVTVDFNTAFSQISAPFTELAVAQVVATIAAQIGPNTGVIFEIDGQRTSVPIASGASVTGAVYLLQFLTAAR
jgi:hypothetical protein